MRNLLTLFCIVTWISCGAAKPAPGAQAAANQPKLPPVLTEPIMGKPLAFPGADGAGKYAEGGRGGDVYKVTNTNDSGKGSLREGIESAKGPRTIVFETSGTIEMQADLEMTKKKNITIAGQTAPGDGITLKNRTFLIDGCEDIIIRFIRVRFGDQGPRPTAKDGMTIQNCDRIILDHVTVSWTVDGMLDSRSCRDFTLQWCFFAEPLHNSIHKKEGGHGKMTSIRDVSGSTTLHHNLFASAYQRFPSLGNLLNGVDDAIFDFRNNVLYNYCNGTNIGVGTKLIVNNYYRWGPDCKESGKFRPFNVKSKGDSKLVHAYINGNCFDTDKPHAKYNKDNYEGVSYDGYDERYSEEAEGFIPGANRQTLEIKPEPDLGWMKLSATQTAQDAYESVLAKAGASLVRDAVDTRVVADVKARTGKIIDSQDQVGGWPALKALPAPKDSDGDGMPDVWETANGLNPKDASDGKTYKLDKQYTNLEVYLNSLVKDIIH